MKEVIITSILTEFDLKNQFFWGAVLVLSSIIWESNLSSIILALGMALTFHTRVAIGLKLKVRKIWGLIPTFVTGKKSGRGAFLSLPLSWIELIKKYIEESVSKNIVFLRYVHASLKRGSIFPCASIFCYYY